VPALIVIAIRLVVPLTILRWPLAGGLLSLVVDAIDVVLVDAIAGILGQPGEFGPILPSSTSTSTSTTWRSSWWSPGAGRSWCLDAPRTPSSAGGSSA